MGPVISLSKIWGIAVFQLPLPNPVKVGALYTRYDLLAYTW